MKNKLHGHIERITDKTVISHLKNAGKRIRCKGFNLVFAENDCSVCRYLVVVPKRIGNAVKRNYQKRICRESMRKLEKQIKPLDFTIIFKKTSINVNFSFFND